MGGGVILILVLTMFLGIEQHAAQATNIIFFIPTSIISIIINSKQKLVDYKIGIIIALSGIIGAIMGAKIAGKIETQNLKKYFGFFLAFIATYEIICLIREYISNKKTNNNKKGG